MRKEKCSRGKLPKRVLTVMVVLLLLAGSPASAVSSVDSIFASGLCVGAAAATTLSGLAAIGSNLFGRLAENAEPPPFTGCGNPVCLGDPLHCDECSSLYEDWLALADQAASTALSNTATNLAIGAMALGAMCAQQFSDSEEDDAPGNSEDGGD